MWREIKNGSQLTRKGEEGLETVHLVLYPWLPKEGRHAAALKGIWHSHRTWVSATER